LSKGLSGNTNCLKERADAYVMTRPKPDL
jgi:hypothetical protein